MELHSQLPNMKATGSWYFFSNMLPTGAIKRRAMLEKIKKHIAAR